MEPHYYVALAAFARPFLALFIFGVLCLGTRVLIQRCMSDGVIKRVLLFDPYTWLSTRFARRAVRSSFR
jgi:hypothetical protein